MLGDKYASELWGSLVIVLGSPFFQQLLGFIG